MDDRPQTPEEREMIAGFLDEQFKDEDSRPAPCSAGWLPIETAPKDGTEVMGWSKRHGYHIGPVAPYKKPEMPKRRGGWFQPSHWMPLPSEPNAREQEPL